MGFREMPLQHRAVFALAQAQGALVAWPPSTEHLANAIMHTALALHWMAQADPDGKANDMVILALERVKQERAAQDVPEPPA